MFRLCPIDAQWSSWPSDWSACSSSCRERGLSFPMRSRARTCIPEKNAGKDCQVLQGGEGLLRSPLLRGQCRHLSRYMMRIDLHAYRLVQNLGDLGNRWVACVIIGVIANNTRGDWLDK